MGYNNAMRTTTGMMMMTTATTTEKRQPYTNNATAKYRTTFSGLLLNPRKRIPAFQIFNYFGLLLLLLLQFGWCCWCFHNQRLLLLAVAEAQAHIQAEYYLSLSFTPFKAHHYNINVSRQKNGLAKSPKRDRRDREYLKLLQNPGYYVKLLAASIRRMIYGAKHFSICNLWKAIWCMCIVLL